MTLRHFRIFQAVCAAGSITGAAEALGMTQPAVSLAVKELESFYETRLFERMNRRIYLTQDGRLLLQYAGTVLAQYEESVRAIREEDHSTLCRLGVNVTVGETWLSGAAQEITRTNPGTELRLFVANAEAIGRALADNTIDLAVTDQSSPSPNCRRQLLYRGEMAAVCAPDAPFPARMTVAQLAASRLLLRERGSASRSLADAVFEQHGCAAEPAAESASSLALLRLAQSGFGCALLPHELVSPQLQAGALREIGLEDGDFGRSYYLLYHKNKYLTNTMRLVIETLRRCAPASGQRTGATGTARRAPAK